MPLAAQRRQRLLALLRHHGALGTRELAERLGVSEATVRRDLALLARQGLLRREHGGALLPEAEPPYAEKLQRNQRAKEAIAQRAAALVPDGATVVLDSGTTALALARLLAGRRKQLKNSPQIRTLFLFRSRFIQKRKTSRRVAKEAKGVK
jgi:DeoR/GlpR family transcriptional regulator of sugar metabolism